MLASRIYPRGKPDSRFAVLSEGQLIEFTDWKTSLTVRNTPISLRYATARVSRYVAGRFIV